MDSIEFIKVLAEIDKKIVDHSDFYEMAEEYGFLAPWSVESLEGCSSVG